MNYRFMDANWKPLSVITSAKTKHVCLAIDVIPYYIEKEYLSRSIDRWVIVGNNYMTHPGTYPHINLNGKYTIYADPHTK